MKLYQEICDNDVLDKVIALVRQAEKTIIVSEGEKDRHQVQPDRRYYQTLSDFVNRGGSVVRYYFGGREEFARHQADNPQIAYHYAGGMENYQRAVIVDGQKAMAKIGRQFVYSENALWVEMLSAYLQNSRVTYLKS